ncbi:MAG TPA: PAS domain S-box protein [Bacteroidota bacterium]|nr:PAS domain S-box protein [Bacteroidota bacterium]
MNPRSSKARTRRGEAEHAPSFLSTLMATSHDPIIGLNGQGTIVSWNSAAERLFGWTAGDIKGNPISRIIAHEHLREAHRMLQRVRRGEEIRQFETMCRGKTDQRFNVSLNVSPYKSENGTVVGLVAVARDITRRLRSRETLVRRNRELLTFHRLSQIALSTRSLEESYRDIVNEIRSATGFPIAVIALVDEARETIVLHGLMGAGAKTSRLSMELPLGKTLSGIVVRTGKPLIITNISRHPEYRGKVLHQTHAQTFVGYPMKVGGKIFGCLNLAHTEIVEIKEETGQWIEGLANYVAVLTERKRAEEDLHTSREQLRELSRRTRTVIEEERKRIARDLHDELGQELSLLQLDLGIIQRRLPPAESDLLNKSKSMTAMIDSAIRSVQRISSDLRPTLLDNLGLGAAAEWAVAQFQKRTKIRCRISVDPPDLALDAERSTALFRILQEALTNVLRHAKATKVDVQLAEHSNEIQLLVKDNGRGIPLLRIKDPKSTGLAGMRERVLPWGGNVAFSGRQGKGTEVTVTVPMKS